MVSVARPLGMGYEARLAGHRQCMMMQHGV